MRGVLETEGIQFNIAGVMEAVKLWVSKYYIPSNSLNLCLNFKTIF